MLNLIVRRIVATVVTLSLISVVAFILIQLPPGDYVDAYAGKKTQGGVIITQEELDVMRARLGLDQPFYRQYLRWIGGVIRGDLGFSYEYHRPVVDVIGERLPLTLMLAFSTLVFTYLVAVPLGIYSAVRQYSVGDYTATVVGYIGLATPNFLFALILLYLGHKWFGMYRLVSRLGMHLGKLAEKYEAVRIGFQTISGAGLGVLIDVLVQRLHEVEALVLAEKLHDGGQGGVGRAR